MRVRAGPGVPEGNVIWVRRSGRKGTAGLQTGIAAQQRSETERCPLEWRRGPPPNGRMRLGPVHWKDPRVLADPGSGLSGGGVGGRGAAAAAGGGGVDEDAERGALRSVTRPQRDPGAGAGFAAIRAGTRVLRAGMQHSPAVGKAISEVIADGESRTLDISASSVARLGHGGGGSGRECDLRLRLSCLSRNILPPRPQASISARPDRVLSLPVQIPRPRLTRSIVRKSASPRQIT